MELFKELEKDIDAIRIKTMNDTAWIVKKKLSEEMARVFDRPTPFTLRSIFIKPATETKEYVEIGLINEVSKGRAPSKYLQSSILGGQRPEKRFEYWMRQAGILPQGMFIVPGPAAPLNQYGNIQGGEYTRILSWLKAHPDVYSRTTSKSKRSKKGKAYDYFLRGTQGHMQGLWKHVTATDRISPVLLFVKQPQYEQRFKFFEVADQTAANEVGAMFIKAMRYQLNLNREAKQ